MCERVTCLTSGSGNQRQNAMLMILLTQSCILLLGFVRYSALSLMDPKRTQVFPVRSKGNSSGWSVAFPGPGRRGSPHSFRRLAVSQFPQPTSSRAQNGLGTKGSHFGAPSFRSCCIRVLRVSLRMCSTIDHGGLGTQSRLMSRIGGNDGRSRKDCGTAKKGL